MTLNLVDTLMVGRVDNASLAALSIARSVWVSVITVSFGTLLGMTPLIAKAYAKKDQDTLFNILGQGSLIALCLGLGGMLIFPQSYKLLILAGQDIQHSANAQSYLNAMAFACVPALLFTSLRQYFEGISNTRPLIILATITFLFNVFGNWILIYGNFGFPAYGLKGAGIATAAANWLLLTMGIVTFYIHLKKEVVRKHWSSLTNWQSFQFGQILWIGFPAGLMLLNEAGMFNALTLVLGASHKEHLPAHQVAFAFYSFVFMIPFSISMGLASRIGFHSGKEDVFKIRLSALTSFLVTLVMFFPIAIWMAFFPETIAQIFSTDTTTIHLASEIFLLCAIFIFWDSIQTLGSAQLRGLKDTRIPLLISIVCFWGISFCSAYWFCVKWKMGSFGIWIGASSGFFVTAVLYQARFVTLTKRLTKASLQ